MSAALNETAILLIYDAECPVCENYCQAVRIKESVGTLKLINARENCKVMAEITAQGLDIDQGMVLILGGQIYYGADAVHALALISSRSGIFNRLNYRLFASQKASRFLYPALKFFRNLLLKIMGKTKINNLQQPNSHKF